MTDNINKPSHYQGANGLVRLSMLCITSLGAFPERLLSFGATQSSICYGFKRKTVWKT